MKKLYLRGCKNTYYKLDKKRKYTVYHNTINNNLIVFSPYDNCTVDSVCGSIRDEAYLYLINELNINKNIVVSWSQITGTTSDYIIYYNMDVDMLKSKLHKEILTIINNSINPINPKISKNKLLEIQVNQIYISIINSLLHN